VDARIARRQVSLRLCRAERAKLLLTICGFPILAMPICDSGWSSSFKVLESDRVSPVVMIGAIYELFELTVSVARAVPELKSASGRLASLSEMHAPIVSAVSDGTSAAPCSQPLFHRRDGWGLGRADLAPPFSDLFLSWTEDVIAHTCLSLQRAITLVLTHSRHRRSAAGQRRALVCARRNLQ